MPQRNIALHGFIKGCKVMAWAFCVPTFAAVKDRLRFARTKVHPKDDGLAFTEPEILTHVCPFHASNDQ